jgi:cytochrome c oxidase assembly protein subunit 15
MASKSTLVWLSLFTAVFALGVLMLGAYVRLSDAGLGCPDWPGCYGHLAVPSGDKAATAQQAYPERPLEARKAWKEMAHRYVASALGLLILAIAWLSWKRRQMPGQMLKVPLLLVGLVVFQGLLGMWTVTLLLKPVVVSAHLLGGMTTLALLWWVTLRQSGWLLDTAWHGRSGGPLPPARLWAVLAIFVVALQISLGGWTSANYAALACPDFPKCVDQWWPQGMDFHNAFILWRGLGVDYEFGVLQPEARVAIHLAHRIGAVVTLLYIGGLALSVLQHRRRDPSLNLVATVMLILVLAQFTLGILNVMYSLPIQVAVAHQGVAALLLLSVITLNHLLFPPKVHL